METRIQKWGNSLALRIPRAFAAQIGLSVDSPVELTLEGDRLVITPVSVRKIRLEDLLAGITANNQHGEVDAGDAVGNECW